MKMNKKKRRENLSKETTKKKMYILCKKNVQCITDVFNTLQVCPGYIFISKKGKGAIKKCPAFLKLMIRHN